MRIWIDGRRRRTLDVSDRGLQYGDGLFETMYVRDGGVRLLSLHLDRLRGGLQRLGIAAPMALVRDDIDRAVLGARRGALKLIVTRGSGPRGYRPRGDERPRRILMLAPAAANSAVPVRLRMCHTRLASGAVCAGLKTLNRLESVLARREWRSPRIFDGLMRDSEDRIVCGTMTNLFLRRGNSLYTPSVARCGVAGVMRRWILRQAAQWRVRARETDIEWRDLAAAEEVFVSNALIGVRSVHAIDWPAAGPSLRFERVDLAARLAQRLETL